MGFLDFLNPLIYLRRKGTISDPYVSRTEDYTIINNKILLNEIPSQIDHVQITEPSTGKVFYESFENIVDETHFIVDYTHGTIQFASTENGKNIRCVYKGTGQIFIPHSRIWTNEQNGSVTETLDQVIDATNIAKNNAITATSNANTAISNANTATSNANTATNNANTAANTNIMIWQNPVANFAAIASTYPTPSLGWTTQTLDNGQVYRYNGSSWVYTVKANVNSTKNWIWQEEKTIASGSNSFTLSNSVSSGQLLEIFDKTYHCKWIETLHWTRTNQVITLTESALSESLTFIITNFG